MTARPLEPLCVRRQARRRAAWPPWRHLTLVDKKVKPIDSGRYSTPIIVGVKAMSVRRFRMRAIVAEPNRAIPFALRRRLVDNDGLTEPLRRELAITGWVRVVVAGDETEARAYAELAGARAPELRDALAAYLSAAPADRHFTAVYTLLRYPGLEPFRLGHRPHDAAQRDRRLP